MIDDIRKNGSTSNTLRLRLRKADSGQGFTGLSTATSGLNISAICGNEASGTTYTGSNLQTITVLGTYETPAASKCRFLEVDATNHAGLYEIHLLDARFAVVGAKELRISVTGVSNLLEKEYVIRLTAADPLDDSMRGGLRALPDAKAGSRGGLGRWRF